eukprot:SAG11_NODE_303_length_11000_cov_7.979635_3_plen_161_part_00
MTLPDGEMLSAVSCAALSRTESEYSGGWICDGCDEEHDCFSPAVMYHGVSTDLCAQCIKDPAAAVASFKARQAVAAAEARRRAEAAQARGKVEQAAAKRQRIAERNRRLQRVGRGGKPHARQAPTQRRGAKCGRRPVLPSRYHDAVLALSFPLDDFTTLY